MKERPVNLASTGIASFCKLPIEEALQEVQADVAILGIPWDEGVGFRPGARLGPREIRNYSPRFALNRAGGYWDVELDRRFLDDVSLVDCGDVDIIYTDFERTFSLITASVKALLDRPVLPVLLGGDHSITFPCVRAFDRYETLDIVQIDAHLDYTDELHGVRHANSFPIKRSSELPFVREIVQLGIHGIRASEKAYRDSLERGNMIVTRSALRSDGIDGTLARLPALGPTYVTIDIDGLDPSIAPGTGSPEPDGLLYWEVKQLLRGIAAKARGQIVGIDLVEVNPLLDHHGMTSLLSTQIILEFLGAIFEQRNHWPEANPSG